MVILVESYQVTYYPVRSKVYSHGNCLWLLLGNSQTYTGWPKKVLPVAKAQKITFCSIVWVHSESPHLRNRFPSFWHKCSYKLGYFSNSRLKFLDSFLKHAAKIKFMQMGNFFEDFMLQAFSLVRYLKGLCSFALYLQFFDAELIFATSVWWI